MLTRILSIDGQAPNKKVVMDLSMRDRSELRREMASKDAGINTEIEIICDDCGHRFKTRLEGERDFLFPGLD